MENNNQNNQNKKPFNKKKHHRYNNRRRKPKKEAVEELQENELSDGLETFRAELEELVLEPEIDYLEDIHPDIFDSAVPAIKEDDNEEKVEVVGIRFKKVGKVYYFAPNGITAHKGEYAIVDTARGEEFGEVFIANKLVGISEIVPPLRNVLRIATKEDIAHNEDNTRKEKEAFDICLKQIEHHELDMKLVDAQYTFDNSKLLFYFTSSGRVDFRELVKDLASVFRTRIELRQIGIRDEAKLIGGLGACGRPLCCATFLSDFVQVSIKMAKEQGLFLNSSKISGTCGRLMCCLKYEHETYEYEIARTPAVDSTVKTPDGVGVVTEAQYLAGKVKVKLSGKEDQPPKLFSRDEVKVISSPKKGDKE